MKSISSNSEQDTIAIAQGLAKAAHSGDVFALYGPPGAGKSVFARGFVRALCGEETDVPSPTYTLVQTYESCKGTVWHFDLYRLKSPEEIYEIGWEEVFADDSILLIEWPERLEGLIPRNMTKVTIEPQSETTRVLKIENGA